MVFLNKLEVETLQTEKFVFMTFGSRLKYQKVSLLSSTDHSVNYNKISYHGYTISLASK